jgi:8-oxo-dGTP diphosphatase
LTTIQGILLEYMQVVTLVFLIRDSSVLLAMKKRGFGIGKWNGAGGKVEPGESLEQAAIRECEEEIYITPQNLSKVGVIDFYLDDFHQQCHIFVCDKWNGEPKESEEMSPKWFKNSEIPYEVMWEDDPYWLPLALENKTFKAEFSFRGNKLLTKNVIIL